MAKYRIEGDSADNDGWTDWIHPLPNYRMACCDCGLVHNLELRIDAIGQPNFRMKRNNRSTALIRRHRKAKEQNEAMKALAECEQVGGVSLEALKLELGLQCKG